MQVDRNVATGVDITLDSVALARVIAEVRTGDIRSTTRGAYNRTYNRHNR